MRAGGGLRLLRPLATRPALRGPGPPLTRFLALRRRSSWAAFDHRLELFAAAQAAQRQRRERLWETANPELLVSVRGAADPVRIASPHSSPLDLGKGTVRRLPNSKSPELSITGTDTNSRISDCADAQRRGAAMALVNGRPWDLARPFVDAYTGVYEQYAGALSLI